MWWAEEEWSIDVRDVRRRWMCEVMCVNQQVSRIEQSALANKDGTLLDEKG